MKPLVGRKKGSYYPDLFRIGVVKEYLAGGITQGELGLKYQVDPSLIAHWVTNFVRRTKQIPMNEKPKKKSSDVISDKEKLLECKVRELQKELKQKDKELEKASLQIFGLDSLIDVAEDIFEIEIRKKPGAKQ